MIKYTGYSMILKKLPFQAMFALILTFLTVLNFSNCAATPVIAEPVSKDAPEAAPFITIVNNTGTTAWAVYISETTADYWGDDWLAPEQIIRNTESVTLQLEQPLSIVNMYDLRLIDYSGNAYTKRNLEISGNGRIVFRASDFSDGPLIRITNNTGVTIWYAYISETTSLSWGKDMLFSDQMIQNGETAMVRLPYSINEVNRYDIRLVEAHSRSEYIKMNVPVASYGAVVFTGNDIYIRTVVQPEITVAEPVAEQIKTDAPIEPEPESPESIDLPETEETKPSGESTDNAGLDNIDT